MFLGFRSLCTCDDIYVDLRGIAGSPANTCRLDRYGHSSNKNSAHTKAERAIGFRGSTTCWECRVRPRAIFCAGSQVFGLRCLYIRRHHMLGVQEVQAACDVQRDAAAVPPPAERVSCAAAVRVAPQRAEQVAALHHARDMRTRRFALALPAPLS